MSKKVFVYGTLKKGFPNHEYLMDATTGMSKFVSIGKTKHAFPMILDPSRGFLPFILNRPGTGKNIFGEIYEVDKRKLEFLNDFELLGELYDAIDVLVIGEDGCQVTCAVYVMHTEDYDTSNCTCLESYGFDELSLYDGDS